MGLKPFQKWQMPKTDGNSNIFRGCWAYKSCVPGSPAGYHPQLESPALWIRQTGLDHYSMVTNYFKIATYYCKSEFKEIYVCQL